MKPPRKSWWRTFVLLGFLTGGVLLYAFTRGPLFPYAPFYWGFERHVDAQTLVYIETGTRGVDYRWVDALLPGVESFHALSFQTKPKLFFFSDSKRYAQCASAHARFLTAYNGVIMVSPMAQHEAEVGGLSLNAYLTHELSHALLYQHMKVGGFWRFPHWLFEGVATSSARQMGTGEYPDKDETRALIRRGNWLPPQYLFTARERTIELDVPHRMPFIYSEMALLVDDLITRFGRTAFLKYMHTLLSQPDHERVFQSTFGREFNAYVQEFRERQD